MTTFIDGFIDDLRVRASERLREGANTAQTYKVIADDLEARARHYYQAQITVAEACQYSGLSPQSIRRIRRGLAEGEGLCRAILPAAPFRTS